MPWIQDKRADSFCTQLFHGEASQAHAADQGKEYTTRSLSNIVSQINRISPTSFLQRIHRNEILVRVSSALTSSDILDVEVPCMTETKPYSRNICLRWQWPRLNRSAISSIPGASTTLAAD